MIVSILLQQAFGSVLFDWLLLLLSTCAAAIIFDQIHWLKYLEWNQASGSGLCFSWSLVQQKASCKRQAGQARWP